MGIPAEVTLHMLFFVSQGEAVEEEVNASFAKNTTAIMPLMSQPGLEEESAESILDQHCSRIWDNSLHHTPSRSPGRQSPRTKSPDRSFARPKSRGAQPGSAAANAASASANASFSRSYRAKKGPTLSKSYDSGMGEEPVLNLVQGETHRHIHHHHHHHHRELSSKQRLELEQNSLLYQSASFEHGRGRTSMKKSVVRKSSEASSNIDSGISVMFEPDSARVVPNWNNPSSEKLVLLLAAGSFIAIGNFASCFSLISILNEVELRSKISVSICGWFFSQAVGFLSNVQSHKVKLKGLVSNLKC